MTGVSTTLPREEEEEAVTTECGADWETDLLQTTDKSALEMMKDPLASGTEAESLRRVVERS